MQLNEGSNPTKYCEFCGLDEINVILEVEEAIEILQRKGDWLTDFGKLLDESWQIKRSLSSKITTDVIDNFYIRSKRKGALGGKILGAGGGGFFLFYVPRDKMKYFLKKTYYLLIN